MPILVCPVCSKTLYKSGSTLRCKKGHSFDIAREGYVNLLLTSKSGDKTGDSRESAHARHAFLSKGYYAPLRDFLNDRMSGTVLDICCGEGYYDDYDGELYGFDISREMIRLASKSRREHSYFVANLSRIPVADASVDTALHLFAPFNAAEFARVLKDGGVLYSVIPGAEHLYEMKSVVYDVPYKNDEKPPRAEPLRLADTHRIKTAVSINGEDLRELFSMTPYFYRTKEEYRARLDSVSKLELTLDFLVLEYRK